MLPTTGREVSNSPKQPAVRQKSAPAANFSRFTSSHVDWKGRSRHIKCGCWPRPRAGRRRRNSIIGEPDCGIPHNLYHWAGPYLSPRTLTLTCAGPPGDNLNHLQSQLRTGPILLVGGLPDLFAFKFAAAAGSQFGILSLSEKPDENRQCPDLVWGKGEGDVQRKRHFQLEMFCAPREAARSADSPQTSSCLRRFSKRRDAPRAAGPSGAKRGTLVRNYGRIPPIHEKSSKQDCEDQPCDPRSRGLHIRWGRREPDGVLDL